MKYGPYYQIKKEMYSRLDLNISCKKYLALQTKPMINEDQSFTPRGYLKLLPIIIVNTRL